MGDTKHDAASAPGAAPDEATDSPPSAVSLVDGLAADATSALFEAYGLKMERDGPLASREMLARPLVSVIGFSSELLSGSLVLALPLAVAQGTLPVPEASLADWSGELANQLLGRLKSKLLQYQVSINMGLPVVVSGDGITLVTTPRQVTRHYSFSSDLGNVLIRLDMELSPNLKLERRVDETLAAAVSEGDQLFF
jgi:CheY-specific phosphatase CheX